MPVVFRADVNGLTVTVTRRGEVEEDAAGTPAREWFVRWGDTPVWEESEVEPFPPEPGIGLSHTYARPGLWFVELFSPGDEQRHPLFEVQHVDTRQGGTVV